MISTSVPESKGRVERSFRTCQDRLTAEMRYNEIKTMTDANRYMEQVFIPAWNEKFSVQAEETTTLFRALAKQIDLSTIFCLKYQRQVNRDHTVHFEGKKWIRSNSRMNGPWLTARLVNLQSGTMLITLGSVKNLVNSLYQLLLLAFGVAIPVERPNAIDAPVQSLEYFLAESVSVSNALSGMV